ncbi:MAG: helicase-related protein [Patescibacteria group bacterium]
MRNHLIADLPVLAYRQAIVDSVREHRVTIITAETGAGKSCLVPCFLSEAGYRVVVTQPRRLAARTLAQRVAFLVETRLGDRVGFRTAEEKCDSAATEILYCTDGLQLVRELAGGAGGTGGRTILVLDEVHEWNLNMEVLVAWARQRIEAGDDLRVVLMSATLDAEGLSRFFGDAPVISVPGRLYPVERRSASGRALLDQAAELAKAGRNVLIFQPGKREIGETVDALESRLGAGAIVLPLHGELEPGEQQRCFDAPPAGKTKVVVATNVAQTSVTIPDVDAVVDSGVERRIELADGIEGLYLKPISRADCEQRAGRAGRTKPGAYVLCSETSMLDRPEFPIAEVLRSRLDQMVLRLAVQGFDATALKFFHQPDETTLAEAKRALVALGAMLADGSVTPVGRRMARLPVSVQFARMLLEAERLGVMEQVATIAACLEAGDIRAREGQWRSLTQERRSDLLAVLDVYNAGRDIKGGGGESKAETLRKQGIFAKDFFRAGEIRRKLLDATGGRLRSESKRFASKDEEREAILRACVAGMVDHLYSGEYGRYRNGGNGTRELARESVVTGSPQWLVGLPFDISGKGKRGRPFTLHLVGMATAVDPTWLVEVAPHLVETKTGLRPAYDSEKDLITSVTETFFQGRKVTEETVADGEHPEAAAVFARWLAGQNALPTTPAHAAGITLDAVLRSNAVRQEQARQLNIRTGEETFKVYSFEEKVERFAALLFGARRVIEVVRPEAIALPALDEAMVVRVLSENPDVINVLGSELVVEYRAPYYGTMYTPRVKLSDEMVKVNGWIRLPGEGIRLPGGRAIEVVVSFGYYATIADTNIPQLKAKVREHLNQEQWDRWTKPEVAVSDPAVESSEIPFITAVYGQCVVTGEELKAYGTVTVNTSRWYASDPWFKAVWYRNLAEAQTAADIAAKKLTELKAEAKAEEEMATAKAQAEAELSEAKAEAESAREELGGLQSGNDWYDLDYELRRRAEERRYSYLPPTAEEIRQWTVETKAIIAKAQTVFTDIQRQREAEAKAQAEAERVEREELAAILREIGEDNLAVAREAKAFAEVVAGISGVHEGIKILRDELTAPYGRGRRQEAISWKVPGISSTDAGSRFLSFYRAGDVDAWLVGAAVWLETKLTKSRVASPVATPSDSKPVDLSKVDLGGLFGGAVAKRR